MRDPAFKRKRLLIESCLRQDIFVVCSGIVICNWYRVPANGYRAPGTGYRAPGTGYRATVLKRLTTG